MVNKKNTRKQKSASRQQQGNQPRARPRRAGAGLDASAVAHAMVLADPCRAPLAHPLYAGGEGGYLIRTETGGIIGNGAAETSFALLWTPGAIGSGGTELVAITNANPATNTTVAVYGNAPGKTFLTATATAYRCVGACLSISFPGAESARAGQLFYTQTTGSPMDVGNSLNVNQMTNLCNHYTRTPTSQVEVRWKPTARDQQFIDPAAPTAAQDKDGRGAILIAAAGLPAATGLYIRYTAVYEWQPLALNGLASNNESRARSSNSFNDVLDYVDRAYGWATNVADELGRNPVAANVVGTVGRYFGLMPAIARMNRPLLMN
jgi:hypothetical protein